MRIERIDEKTVKCYLSNEELEEYDIDYKDFIMRSEKAKIVVQEIIEQAEEEVGYKPPRFAFDLQIMMLPDQGLILTFSEKDSEIREGEQLIECLKEMKRVLQRAREKVGMIGNQENAQSANTGENPESAQRTEEPRPIAKPSFAVFVFSSIGRVMEYAAVLPVNLRVDSVLYEMNGLYFLFMIKGHASYERYSRACIQAMEFGSLYAADPAQVLLLEEHGECLIAEKAIKKLRG